MKQYKADGTYNAGEARPNNGRGKFVQRAPFPAEARALAKYRAFIEPKGVAR